MRNLKVVALFMSLLLVGCNEGGSFKEAKVLAGKSVSADTLNLGHTTYVEYCIQCHGKMGNGKGVSANGMYPPPRDFTLGIYKFGNVVIGELPHDEDFYRIIRQGLHGTAMLPWDISDKRLDAVTQYIKTFAPAVWEGEGKAPGTKFELPADPYGPDRKAEAIEKGKRAYHVTAACIQCHRGYESKDQITAYSKEIDPKAAVDLAEDLYSLKLQDSEFGFKVVPPDFTWHPLRTVTDNESLMQRLMYGVAGSGMPGWKDVVTDEELWALTYYIQSLRELRNTPQREALLENLKK